MAQQEASPSPGAEVVGRAFVEQYYHILHQSPGLVHRFYQDSSLLTRPDVTTGTVTTVTTMQAINDKILSLKYEDYTAEIETADAQESHERGVIVLVTGRLTGNDNVRKKFSQTFFLAPQDKGYFVLNDVFRFLEEKEATTHARSVTINGTTRDVQVSLEPERVVVSHEAEVEPEPVASIEEEDLDNVAEVYDPSDKDEGVVVDVEPIEPPPQLSHNDLSVPPGDAPKHSYASILKLMKSGPAPTQVVRQHKPRPAQVSTNQKTNAPPAETSAAPEPSALENVPHSSNVDVEDDGHSIYVRNLPFDSTPTQLEDIFKKFGAIKHEGIQVRSNKQQGFCFGFVEFETSSGKQCALEASPITIGDRQAVLEEKKTNSRGGNSGGGSRGRYYSGRGSFRNESFKGGRGGGGRGGYGRGGERGGGEFSGRPKSSNPRNGGEGYQRVPQNGGGGRGGRGGPRGGGSS